MRTHTLLCLPSHLLVLGACTCCIFMHTFSVCCRKGQGSGCFVFDSQRLLFFLLTCCHNFVTKADSERLLRRTNGLTQKEEEELQKKITENCKAASYEVSDRNYETHAKAASDVLLDYENPRLYFVQVQGDPCTCACVCVYICTIPCLVYCSSC